MIYQDVKGVDFFSLLYSGWPRDLTAKRVKRSPGHQQEAGPASLKDISSVVRWMDQVEYFTVPQAGFVCCFIKTVVILI